MKIMLLLLSVFLIATAQAASVISVSAGRRDCVYAAGEKARFRVTVSGTNGVVRKDGRLTYRVDGFDRAIAVKQTPADIRDPYTVGAWIWGDWLGHEGAMRADERAHLKTGHGRVFFIQTENKAGPAFSQLKAVWQDACDRLQGTKTTVFGT